MSDEQIDKAASPVWFLFRIDSMSHFVERGPDYPEEFPKLIAYYQTIGYLILLAVGFVCFALVCGALTGRLTIG